MSLDLLHVGPIFLVSFVVAAAALLLILTGMRREAIWTWRVVVLASLIDFILGLLQQEEWTVRGLVWAGVTTLWLVTIPVAIGAGALSRWKVGLSTSPALVYAGAVLVGIGTGWILLPIVLAIATGLVTALRG
jgi:hypothetical protein